MESRSYIAIDLKSFYASAECVDRGLDPLATNLVVADASRTERTICLAVSPPLKALGVPGRPRLFEVVEKMREINAARLRRAPGRRFRGRSWNAVELASDPSLEAGYITATPRMSRYLEVSAAIYGIYLRRIAAEDIHVYSVDEVFVDATRYLALYGMTARQLTAELVRAVLRETGITATAGIGTNLYLAKVAMDIVAKHSPADADGVRVAELDEAEYRRRLWGHRPLTDFWRVGAGYAARLEARGMRTMGDVARMSLTHEESLYRLFGVNAELLIDHAWGWEPCTLAAIKAYRPRAKSVSIGQVLPRPYAFAEGRLVVREMAVALALELTARRLVAREVGLCLGYDTANLAGGAARPGVDALVVDHYGRLAPRPAHGALRMEAPTASGSVLLAALTRLFDGLAAPGLLIRRVNVEAGQVCDEAAYRRRPVQLELAFDAEPSVCRRTVEAERERRRQEAILAIRGRLGGNALLLGMDLEEGATARERNCQIGGHRA